MITDAMRRAVANTPPRPGTWHPAYEESREALLHWMRHGPTEHLLISSNGIMLVITCEESAELPEPRGGARELVRMVAAGPSEREGHNLVWWCAVDDLGRQLAEPEAQEVAHEPAEEDEVPDALVSMVLMRLIGPQW